MTPLSETTILVPKLVAILGSALSTGVLACSTQWDAVKRFVDEPGLGPVATGIKAIYDAMANGFVSKSGVPVIDELFSRGGMSSLLSTVWLVLAALSFAAILEHAGFLERLLRPIVERARTRGQLILAVNASGVGLNVVAGDQYVADVLPSRMFSPEFQKEARAGSTLARGRGLGNGHVRPRPVEHVWRLHVRRARRLDRVVLPLQLLQLAEPDPRRRLRVRRLQGPAAGRHRSTRRPGTRTSPGTQRARLRRFT